MGRGTPPGRFITSGRSTRRRPASARTDYAGNFAAFLDERDAAGGEHPPSTSGSAPTSRTAGTRSAAAGGPARSPGDVDLPAFYPDRRAIREDLLDYAVEVEHFDRQLGLALDELERRGELANTLVVVTSDHGMPFPRVKGQIYEWGFHLPLAVMGPGVAGSSGNGAGRVVEDFINVRDFAPTFLETAGAAVPDSVTGTGFRDLLESRRESGKLRDTPDEMLVGKERHDVGRPGDAGYPVRALRTPDYLYVYNFAPDRWPAGNPETGYRNVDDGATKERPARPVRPLLRALLRQAVGGGVVRAARRRREPDEPRRRPGSPGRESEAAGPPVRAAESRRRPAGVGG